MIFRKALAAWQTNDFNTRFKTELQLIEAAALPLQEGISQGGYVADDEPFTAIVLSACDSDTDIKVKTGVFYNSSIAGCNCADDPTPVDKLTEYCELLVVIDKSTAKASISLLNN